VIESRPARSDFCSSADPGRERGSASGHQGRQLRRTAVVHAHRPRSRRGQVRRHHAGRPSRRRIGHRPDPARRRQRRRRRRRGGPGGQPTVGPHPHRRTRRRPRRPGRPRTSPRRRVRLARHARQRQPHRRDAPRLPDGRRATAVLRRAGSAAPRPDAARARARRPGLHAARSVRRRGPAHPVQPSAHVRRLPHRRAAAGRQHRGAQALSRPSRSSWAGRTRCSCSPTRTSRRRRRRAARHELPLAGPVVRVHLAPVRAPQCLPAVYRRLGRPDGVAHRRRSAARDHRRGPPGVPGPLRPGPPLRRAGPGRSRARARDRRHRHRTARVLRPAHPVPRGRRSARPAVHRGDLRPGPGRRPVRRLRPRHHPGQQPERRPDRERLDDQEGLEEVESYTQHKNVYLRF
jgi:hypothetical protein